MARMTGRRMADPPFPASLRLLGRSRSLIADRSMPDRARRLMLSVLSEAVAKLDAEQAAGLLTDADRLYIGALKGFALGRGRSGQHRGVFIVGLADAKASQDAQYWSGALVHDGVHALVQGRGRGLRYLDEAGPCEAQIDYLARTGANQALIEAVGRFKESRAGQRRRAREPV